MYIKQTSIRLIFNLIFILGLIPLVMAGNRKPGKMTTYAIAEIQGNCKTTAGTELRGVYLPFNAIELEPNNSESVLTLKWKGIKASDIGKNPLFRLSLVSDLVTFQSLEVTSNKVLLGNIDLSLGNAFQLLQLKIPADKVGMVLKEGIQVRAKGEGPAIKVFASGDALSPGSLPHLLIPGKLNPYKEFLNRMASRSSVTAYGWEEGCVIDGLALLTDRSADGTRFKAALNDHLSLIYPKDDQINQKGFGIEGTSCIAQLALKNPAHPDIKSVLAFWDSRKDSNGAVNDGTTVVAEGNYTVAWPLAVLSKQLNRPDLAEMAANQLRLRRDRLVDEEGAIWLRCNQSGVKTYRLWSRGVAWYLLGMAKTLDMLPVAPPDLVKELQRATAYLIRIQGKDGMWKVFAGEMETAPESSGTSGIATAMAIGIRRGWLGKEAEKSARSALMGLQKRLTPDGYLDGTAQSNKGQGGEKFQRATKGTTCQWGMGMFAQLVAELDPPKN